MDSPASCVLSTVTNTATLRSNNVPTCFRPLYVFSSGAGAAYFTREQGKDYSFRLEEHLRLPQGAVR